MGDFDTGAREIPGDPLLTRERFLMRARRILIALSSLAVIGAGLTLTPNASADSVQVQSYQRAGQSEACAAQLGETPWEAAWGADSTWHPTWERWANGGTGGWTCTRSITWAKSAPTIGCVEFENDGSFVAWVNFGSVNFLGGDALTFSDAGCSVPRGITTMEVVYATDYTEADALCESEWAGRISSKTTWMTPHVFFCT